MEGLHGSSRRQSHRGDHALDRGLDPASFCLITLSITPLRKLTGQSWLIRYRRMFGLFAFFYAMLHFLTYIWLDKFFDLHEIWADVLKRRFITVGFHRIRAADSAGADFNRRDGFAGLGGKRWQALHRLIYLSAIAGVIHYWWLVKADISKPASMRSCFLCYWDIGWWCGSDEVKEERSRPPHTSARSQQDRLFSFDCVSWTYTKVHQTVDNFLGRIVFKVSVPSHPQRSQAARAVCWL